MSISSIASIEKIKKSIQSSISIEDIFKNIKDCSKCDLKNKLQCNKDIVKSTGRYNAPIMIIGKNPSTARRGNSCFGVNDSVNYPILNKLLNRYKLSMNDVYSTNLVKCSTENNLDPNRECLQNCKEFIELEISIVNPKIIICCGKFSSSYFNLNFGENKVVDDRIFVSIKHPSSLSYGKNEDEEKKYYEQLECIKDELKNIYMQMFVQLHFHDEYSIRDALGKIEDYMIFAKENYLPAFSTTNHGNIGGFIRQYLSCKKLNIKPIFGCEIYINENRHEEIQKDLEKDDRRNFHLCIYAKNIDGFNNLSKITSDAWINGFYYRPRTDLNFIKQHSKGLVASSACLAGEIQKCIQNKDLDAAIKKVEQYKEIFEEFFIELLVIDMDEQREMNNELIKLAKLTNTKTIITCDTHYMFKEYSKIHDIMLLIRDNYTIKDLSDPRTKNKVFQYKVKDLYYKNVNDLYDDFKKSHITNIFNEEIFWSSIDNTYDFVYNLIENIQLDTTLKLPKLSDHSNETLKEHLLKGFEERKHLFDNIRKYHQRMTYEYDILCKKGFADYFLIMEDVIKWAKSNNIYCGAGRGSSSGSLCAYLLRITEIDPIKYKLLFERFIDIAREDLVDIDSDYEPRFRDKIKEYIISKFGQDNVCTIGTYGTYKSRGTLLDVARVHNIPLFETIQLTKNVMTSDTDSMTFEEIRKEFAPVDKYFDTYPEILQPCNVIRGQIRTISKHAAGMIISDRNLSENIALMQTGGNIFSAWQEGSDFHELSTLGFVKFDILGLNNLSVIKDCIELIKQRHNIDLNFYEFEDMNNIKALELANNADTLGIFQFESRISRDLLKKVGVDKFLDLSHISALLRPGPLRAGVDNTFAKRKKKQERYEIPNILRDVLEETFGIMIYQEQIMLIAQKIGDFSAAESNVFRKALVKYGKGDAVESKRLEKAFSFKDKFISNAIKHITQDQADDLWEKMVSFVNYGFNRAHSIAYAYISYVQLYLKANYFIEFMTALLNNTERAKETNQRDSYLKMYINYAKEKGLKILNPDVNLSQRLFSILDDNTIIFGFDHIKNMGDAGDEIIEKRPYKDFYNFFEKVIGKVIEDDSKQTTMFKKRIIKKEVEKIKSKVNKSKVESLILSGAFDKFGDRNKLLEIYNTKINKQKDYVHKNLSRKEIINKEIDTIMLCLSSSIFPENIDQKIKQLKYKKPSQVIQEELDEVNVAGYLSKITENKIKSGKNIGKKYYQVTIIDDLSQLKINIFNAFDIKFIDENRSKYEENFIVIAAVKRHNSDFWNLSKNLEGCIYEIL